MSAAKNQDDTAYRKAGQETGAQDAGSDWELIKELVCLSLCVDSALQLIGLLKGSSGGQGEEGG